MVFCFIYKSAKEFFKQYFSSYIERKHWAFTAKLPVHVTALCNDDKLQVCAHHVCTWNWIFYHQSTGKTCTWARREHLPVKYIIYLFPDISSESQKLAIYSVNYCLEEISFSWIFTIKQVKKLYNNKETYIFVTINKL